MATNTSTNTDIDYIQKDFNSSLDAMVSFATVNFGPGTSANRLWTDFNTDSFSRNWLEIVAFIADVFFFYFDNQATQSYLQTATITSAVTDIAKQFGFSPAGASSASGNATFTVTGAVTIPRGFKVKSSTGLQFYTTNDIVASSAGQVTGSVLQGIIKTEQFTSKGIQSEVFNLIGPNVITDLTNQNTNDITPQVTVNGNAYTLVTTFIDSNGTDTAAVTDTLGEVIGGGGRVFTLNVNSAGTNYIQFGDGVFGRKLVSGDVVSVIYRTGGGSAGNIGKTTLTSLVSSNPAVSSVTNAAVFSGGNDPQTISELTQLIPASLRTLNRAVALSDYADLLTANFSQVFAASAARSSQAGVDLNVYVVPQGSGITLISENPSLKNTLTNFLDLRKMVTTQFQILDAFGVSCLITVDATIANTSSQATVKANILKAIDNFFNLSTGGPNGSGIGFSENILSEDISAVIKAISGIDRFEIRRFSYRPRIAQSIVGLLTTYITSPVSIFPGVERKEWLAAAAGPVAETTGTVLFSNSLPTSFTYNSGTGLISYNLPVDLTKVAPGDLFRDGASANFEIFAVNTKANTLYISSGQTVNTTAGLNAGGSIRAGSSQLQTFKCFSKILATTTNLSINNITDSNLDLSIITSTATSIEARVLLDNSKVFVPNQYASSNYYLVDAASNIWSIVSNTSDTLTVGVNAINNAAITSVTGGTYQIVQALTGSQVVFSNEIFSIQYNNANTIFSIGAEFINIGTIGDQFEIVSTQSNVGYLGVPLNLIAYDSTTKIIQLNGVNDLTGINSTFSLIDKSGQVFNVVGIDDRNLPSEIYAANNRDNFLALEGLGSSAEIAQGFKVSTTATYSAVSFNLNKQGNIQGLLTATIVNNSGGLPNLSSVVAVSNTVNLSSLVTSELGETGASVFNDIVFTFVTPPSLTAGVQYHLVLSHDAAYTSSFVNNNTVFSNSTLVPFTYNSATGVVAYTSAVTLSSISPGNYFEDKLGNLFSISTINQAAYQLTLTNDATTGLPPTAVNAGTPTAASQGSVIQNDEILVGVNHTLHNYPNGELSRYNSTTGFWSNSTLGPESGYAADAIFSIEGTQSIIVESNLTPVLGTGATISKRYYDDNNEISFIIGNTAGTITYASDVNAVGIGTVASIPNSNVDTFTFRSSPYVDDIINLRPDEIPQISDLDTVINIFGGVD